jgi:hypothetical protein
MSKATPIEQLPNTNNNENVQMNMHEEQSGGNVMPPQPHMGQQMQPSENQMNSDMGIDHESQRMDSQANFMDRQFVSQSRMGPPPTQSGYGNHLQREGDNQQMPRSISQNFSNDTSVDNSQDSSIFGIFKLLMSQSKMLSVIFILLLCVQLETTQGLFRKVTRMIKVPDGMVFTTSKVLSAFIGVIVFFIVHRNL